MDLQMKLVMFDVMVALALCVELKRGALSRQIKGRR